MHGVTQREVEITCGSSGKLKSSKIILSLVLVLALAFSSLALAACSSPEPASAPASSVADSGIIESKKFLEELEAVVEDLEVLAQKYKSNPSNPDVTREKLTSIGNKFTELSKKYNEIESGLTGDDLKVFKYDVSQLVARWQAAKALFSTTQETDTSGKTTPQAGSTDHKQFLAEYEAWVDKYVEFMKKFKENPTNLSLLTEYTSLATEQMEWSKKVDDIQGKITGEDLQTLTRIIQKLTSALM